MDDWYHSHSRSSSSRVAALTGSRSSTQGGTVGTFDVLRPQRSVRNTDLEEETQVIRRRAPSARWERSQTTIPLLRRLAQAGGSGLDLDDQLVQALIAIQPRGRRLLREMDSHEARTSAAEGHNRLQEVKVRLRARQHCSTDSAQPRRDLTRLIGQKAGVSEGPTALERGHLTPDDQPVVVILVAADHRELIAQRTQLDAMFVISE